MVERKKEAVCMPVKRRPKQIGAASGSGQSGAGAGAGGQGGGGQNDQAGGKGMVSSMLSALFGTEPSEEAGRGQGSQPSGQGQNAQGANQRSGRESASPYGKRLRASRQTTQQEMAEGPPVWIPPGMEGSGPQQEQPVMLPTGTGQAARIESAAREVLLALHQAKLQLTREMESNLKQLKMVLKETERIAREMEAVLREAKGGQGGSQPTQSGSGPRGAQPAAKERTAGSSKAPPPWEPPVGAESPKPLH
jgi:hypothetical protein